MKKLLLLIIAFVFVSCAHDTVKPRLRAYVEQNKHESKYSLTYYEIVDTITYARFRDSLNSHILSLISDLDKEELQSVRDREFNTFRTKNDEYDVLHGKLRDASPWLTELRLTTEKADSLIADFDNVRLYNYDYQYCMAWYKRHYYYFYGSDVEIFKRLEKAYADLLTFIKKNELLFTNGDILFEGLNDEVYRYEVLHSYSTVNKLLDKKMQHLDVVYFDADWNYIESIGM